MHDVGMNTTQLAAQVAHIDEAVGLARRWSHDLALETDANEMDRTCSLLRKATEALDAAQAALAEAPEAIEADHNSYGGASVKLV